MVYQFTVQTLPQLFAQSISDTCVRIDTVKQNLYQAHRLRGIHCTLRRHIAAEIGLLLEKKSQAVSKVQVVVERKLLVLGFTFDQ
jgi:hypothetical protein